MNRILNKFHRHRYKIIGTWSEPSLGNIHADIVCKCGKHGSICTSDAFSERIMKQTTKGKYLNIPFIYYAEQV